MDTTGRLVLAATPLGNIGDASPRLVDAIATADVIAAEDTRRLRTLAAVLGVTVNGRVVSHYDGVASSRVPALLDAVRAGQTVLVLTDAGMPTVSDPGYRLVTECAAAGLPVTCLPGPSAVVAALALSGVPGEKFCFEGAAPRRPAQRRRWLASLATEPRTVVFFEAPHRLTACLYDAAELLGGDRAGAVCRELTKLHEQVLRGSLDELAAAFDATPASGEITVVLAGAAPARPPVRELVQSVREQVAGGARLRDAVASIAEQAGVSRRELYDAATAARDTPAT